MSWSAAFLLYVLLILALIAGGAWIGVALGFTGLVGMTLFSGTQSWQTLGDILWNSTNSFVLTAVPLFVFMGELILRSGLSRRFYSGIGAWLRGLPGGLVHTNIVGCAVFSAVSGSSTATAITIGTVAVPELRKRGYSDRFVLGSLAGGGTLGILIPPSLAMVLYGAMVNESVAELFMAGILPGVLQSVIFMIYIALRVYFQPDLAPREATGASWKERLIGLRDCLPIIALIVVIIGAIYLGYATPTEAAGLGCLGALAIGLAFRDLDWQAVMDALSNSVAASCMMMFIVVCAQVLTYAMGEAKIATEVANFFVNSKFEPWQFMLLLSLMYVVLGCFIDGISMIVLTVPILYPSVIAMGFSGIWFGVILVVLIEVGQLTPPVGLNLVAIQAISDGKSIEDVTAGSLPYVVLLCVTLLLLYLFPEVVMVLPGQMSAK